MHPRRFILSTHTCVNETKSHSIRVFGLTRGLRIPSVLRQHPSNHLTQVRLRMCSEDNMSNADTWITMHLPPHSWFRSSLPTANILVSVNDGVTWETVGIVHKQKGKIIKRGAGRRQGWEETIGGLGQEQSGRFMASSHFFFFLLLVFFPNKPEARDCKKPARKSFYKRCCFLQPARLLESDDSLFLLCLDTCHRLSPSAPGVLLLQCFAWEACSGKREKKRAACKRGGVYFDIN